MRISSCPESLIQGCVACFCLIRAQLQLTVITLFLRRNILHQITNNLYTPVFAAINWLDLFFYRLIVLNLLAVGILLSEHLLFLKSFIFTAYVNVILRSFFLHASCASVVGQPHRELA